MVSIHTNEIGNCKFIVKTPKEVEFFKQLHAELKKVSIFFTKAKKEIKIRFARVQDGIKIIHESDHVTTAQDKWMLSARSAFKLHNNLLSLETFAIINYCAFSKILNKHDQKTGYRTKMAFMEKVVSQSSFAVYPDLLDMIQCCEAFHDQVSKNIGREETHKLGMVGTLHAPLSVTKEGVTFGKFQILETEIAPISNVEMNDTKTDAGFGKRSFAQMLATEIAAIKKEGKHTDAGIKTFARTITEGIGRLRKVSEDSTALENYILGYGKMPKKSECRTVDYERHHLQNRLVGTGIWHAKKQRLN